MARCFQNFQADFAEFQNVAVMSRSEGVTRLRRGAKMYRHSGAVAQSEMPGDEISVKMSEEDVLNFQAVLGGKGEVLIGIALRIDHHGRAAGLVTDDVRSVGQTRQVELFEDHWRSTRPHR